MNNCRRSALSHPVQGTRVSESAAGVFTCSGRNPIPISRAGIRPKTGKRARSRTKIWWL